MGRHSLPDGFRTGATGPRRRARRRNVALMTALVLAAAGGTAAAVDGGLVSFGSTCWDSAVRLRIAAAPGIAPALKEAADYARDNDVTSDGSCLDVRVTARDSYQVTDALRSKEKSADDFEAWVPDSGVWVSRVMADGRSTPVTPAGNVASSPVGVAMIPTAAKSLGWPAKTYSWTELAATTTTGDRLKLGAGNPSRSATGLLALTRLKQAAGTSKDGDILAAATAKALSLRASDSDSQVLDTLPRDLSGTEQANPSRNQALILSEQAAFAYNTTADSGDDLDLFYPKDGSPLLDYPFALVDEPALTTDESRAALRFMTLLGESDGRRIMEKHGFRTDDDDIPDELVTRAGGRAPQPYKELPGPPATDKEIDEALGMWTITVQSTRLTTVVDISASMAKPVPGTSESRLDVTKAALSQALATFTPEDEVGLWTFSRSVDGKRDYRVLVPTERLGGRAAGSTQRDLLSAAFDSLEPVKNGATGLYDTTLAAYKEATASYTKGKFNGLVLLTDGVNDDPGSISRADLVAQLRELTDPKRPVPLIAIAVGPEADKAELDEIAAATGGSGHLVTDPSEVHSVILKAVVRAGDQS
ncbi:substrate-binding and VWA domain-containing protein [Streptomyces sp. NBC_00878]|uniref:substrate-binding and VWA domain-containing protein n=1 Tax=Streptomyces sp. NBC_00878 TaxID=2975854 RepID=UPI0022511353|nr:substrate-binding and VWA domain-containing protein [Streptomyces sp. NBC_00878]MCX4910411.1 substrate-binding and VWA domain-containing protein [Streptomyces sp. NBC_00878]